ncbi:MAG: DUF5057 domain-containing protein, partial [Wujia sp.]
MKRNKKLFIAAISSLLVMVMAVTAITFSLADENNTPTGAVPGEAVSGVDTGLTNIDYIIKNSKDTSSANYSIVEIGPGENSNSSFGVFANGGDFETYVINGNKSAAMPDDMTPDRIDYKYFQASQVTDEDTEALEYITNADFIYISNNTSSTYDANKGTDINEELFNLLKIYALTNYKPLIIDSPTVNSSEDVISTGMSFKDLVEKYYGKLGAAYNVFKWNSYDTGNLISVDDFLSGGLTSSYSSYRAINGKSRSANWTNVTYNSNKVEMAEILVINDSGISNAPDTISNLLFDGATPCSPADLINADTSENIVTDGNQIILDVTTNNTVFYQKAYSTKYDAKPELVRLTALDLDDLTSDDAESLNFDQYDMILFESSCNDITDIDSEVSKKLIAAMYAGKHIVYDPNGIGASDSSSDSSGTVSNASNYLELFYLVATEKEVARNTNIMVTSKGKMDIITSSKSASTCKQIADIINGASYRGIGGPGSASTMFTVLEIQPCYPIDEELASAMGDTYYNKPSEMVNGKTAEQIGYTYNNGKMYLNGVEVTTSNAIEYYKWELSEANVAEALNMDASQVKVVHMSSEELSSSKVEILGNYDMIYIGGNYSAKNDVTGYRSLTALAAYGNNMGDRNLDMSVYTKLPIYVMYSHNGDFVSISGQNGLESANLTAVTDYTGSYDTTFGFTNGNDLSYENLVELMSYVDAGLPVVISDKVSAAFDIVYDSSTVKTGINANETTVTRTENSYLQNGIDPDSNMAKFLDYCKLTGIFGTQGSGTAKTNTILWNFKEGETELVDNDGGVLGDTATGYVSVFKTDTSAELLKLYNNSNTRAKLAVTSMPPVYDMYNSSTKLETKTLDFKFDVTGSDNYTVKLYSDYNLDSYFSEDELLATASGSSATSLSCNLGNIDKYGAEFYGPVYWKLELTDNNTGAQACTTNIAYIKAADGTPKKQVNVIQIIPATENTTGPRGEQNLLFCTKCQRSQIVLNYNPNAFDQGFQYTSYYDGHLNEDGTGIYRANGGTEVYIGLHEHEFGIVKYDSTLKYAGAPSAGMDDWDENLADELSDLYDFTVTIKTTREVEAISEEVREEAAKKLPEFNSKNNTNYTSLDQILLPENVADLEKFKNMLKAEATTAYTEYKGTFAAVDSAKDDLNALLDEMIAYGEGKTYGSASLNLTFADIFQRIKDEEYYEDYFVYQFGVNEIYNDVDYWRFNDYKELYEIYAHALDAKIVAREEYDRLNRIANFDCWYNAYQCLIIGPAENFNNDDITTTDALDDVEAYVQGGGSTILFHSIMSNYDKGSTGPVQLSNRLRSLVGMEANHLEVDTSILNTGNFPQTYSTDVTTTSDYNSNPYDYIYVKTTDGQYNASFQTEVYMDGQDAYYTFNVENGWTTAQRKDGNKTGTTINYHITLVTGSNSSTTLANKEVVVTINGKEYTGTTNENGVVDLAVDNFKTTVTTYTDTYQMSDVQYIPYKAETITNIDGSVTTYSSTKYFMTNLSYKSTSDTTRFVTWATDMYRTTGISLSKKYLTNIAYTDFMWAGIQGNNGSLETV